MSENVGIGRKFEVPDDWDVSTIESNITDIGDGGTPDTSVEHYFGGNIRWAKIEDINFKIGDTENHLTEEGLNNSSAKLWPEGSVIVTTGATIGKVGITQEPIATKQGITGIVTNHNLDSRYFAYYLLSERKSLQRFAQGGTFEEIRPYILKRLRLPLPPIHEQRRIAEILSTVDELIHQTDAVIEQTERLKRGLMQDLLTQGIGHELFKTVQIGPKVVEIPIEWEVKTMDSINVKDEPICYGVLKPGLDTENGIPLIKIEDLQGHQIASIDTVHHITEELHQEFSRSRISGGEVLISIQGTIGRVAIVPHGIPEANISRTVARITPNEEVNPVWLKNFLLSIEAKSFMKIVSSGSTRSSLNIGTLRQMKVFLPPLSEQRRIADILSTVDDSIQEEKQTKLKLEALKRGLMQDLLTGKVRVPVET